MHSIHNMFKLLKRKYEYSHIKHLSDFSAVNSLLDTEATRARTQYGSTLYEACNAMHKFSIAASRNFSNAVWLLFVPTFSISFP